MTNQTEKHPKHKPAYHIFIQEAGKSKYAGVVFRHKTGKGFNILIGDKCYSAFEAKTKSETPEESA